MKDWKLDFFQIFHGGLLMSLPLLFVQKEGSVSFLLLFLTSGILYWISSRKKSVLLYLIGSAFLTVTLFFGGKGIVEKICLFCGGILGSIGYFSGRKGGTPGFFGGPAYGFLFFAPVAYVLGVTQKVEFWKNRSCFLAALYVLLCVFYESRKAFLKYIRENQMLHRFPGKRLKKQNQKVVFFIGCLLACSMAAGFFLAPGNLKFRKAVSVEQDQEVWKIEQPERRFDPESFLKTETKEPPLWLVALGEIIYWIVMIGGGLLLIILIFQSVRRILLGYQHSFKKRESLLSDQEEDVLERIRPQEGVFRKRFGKKTAAEMIRKYYKKRIRSASQTVPRFSGTPSEVEEEAGIRDAELHVLYEKARYSGEKCSMDEIKSLKQKRMVIRRKKT